MKGNFPLVSVVIPTYNRASLVCETIDSVLEQSYTKIEIILVDDGSTDSTKQVIKPYEQRSNFKYLYSPHVGASTARNLGVDYAGGEFIAFLDSDDLYDPEKIALSVAALKNSPDAILVHSSWVQWTQGSNEKEVASASLNGDVRDAVLRFGRISTSTVLVRRETFSQVGGFDESMWLVEDYDLWCRLAGQGLFECVDEALTTVRIHEDNSVRDPEAVKQNQLRVIQKYFDGYDTKGLGTRNFYIANSLYAVASLYFTQSNLTAAFGELVAAVKLDWRDESKRATGMIKFVAVNVTQRVFRKMKQRIVNMVEKFR